MFHLFELAGAIGCLIACGIIGFQQFGILGGLVGAVLGVIGGYWLGRMPEVISVLFVDFYYRRMATEELRVCLHGPTWEKNHWVFSELVRRKEDISQELEVVLSMLVAGDNVKRYHGITILKRFFPDLAEKVPEYEAFESLDTCKKKLLEAGLIR